MTGPKTSLPVEIVFVCTGNICRSPMAEVIAKAKAEEAGLEDNIIFSSCGMGNWHVGQPADKRALAELKSAGYNGDTHRAAQLGPEHMRADLFVALDSGHAGELAATGVPNDKIRLMRSFDPESNPTDDVADPYYGTSQDFVLTRENIEDAMPGLLEWVRDHIRTDS
ncbi:low molecular weight protein-tyrosine-phosphatase [Corynebacterium glutamicum]|uniref:low molecular weight protein-tyrosine-phosphatase n=1 Tax=Corynebacterium glutamicum TaxID=1718 RepID=UPI001B8B36CE|nr:low molecular weight protein-tyrosine-phosphatase [Corynebacterium glutamicum]